jgi:hypothetical protein
LRKREKTGKQTFYYVSKRKTRFDGSAVKWRCTSESAFKQRQWRQGKNIIKSRKKHSFHLSFYAPKLVNIRNFSMFYSTTFTSAILSYQYQPRHLRDSCAKVPSVSLILLHKSTILPFLDSQGQHAQRLFLHYSSNLPRLRVCDPTSIRDPYLTGVLLTKLPKISKSFQGN